MSTFFLPLFTCRKASLLIILVCGLSLVYSYIYAKVNNLIFMELLGVLQDIPQTRKFSLLNFSPVA